MAVFQFRPIAQWPRPFTKFRRGSRFDVDYNTTKTELAREMDYLDARNVVIQLALVEADIRQDGYPRASARPAHPGVILSYEIKTGSKLGVYSMPADAYDDWKDNLRAIVKTLEALRTVDRHGVTTHGEQYTGWKALPAPKPKPPSMSPKDAAEALCLLAKVETITFGISVQNVLADAEIYRRLYRQAVKETHPDTGGTHEDFCDLQEAKASLDYHHKL